MAPPPQLLCPDILAKVFEHLAPGSKPTLEDSQATYSEWRIRRLTLTVSPRICSLLTAPALDVLWSVMDDVRPLFVLFLAYFPEIGVRIKPIIRSYLDEYTRATALVPMVRTNNLPDTESRVAHLWLKHAHKPSRTPSPPQNFTVSSPLCLLPSPRTHPLTMARPAVGTPVKVARI